MGKLIAVCTSKNKGERKKNVGEALLVKGLGIEGDGHAGFAHRQVSLLAMESIQKMVDKGLDVGPGDFAENLTTVDMELVSLPVGTRLKAGNEAVLRVSQIGKECHDRCAIYQQAGDCVMPREGIFAEVIVGGKIVVDDELVAQPVYRFGVITASDKGALGDREDKSGPVIGEMLLPWGEVVEYRILPDERAEISAALKEISVSGMDVIFTTGGTGLTPRDITPEATLDVIERQVPGITEAMRRENALITPRAMLSRGIAGILGKTLIINLPGSPKAVRECMEVLIPVFDHVLETISGQAKDCAR